MTPRLPAWLRQWFAASEPECLHRCAHDNVYHCTVQKSASQWLRQILADPRVFRYCGLSAYQYQSDLPGGFDARRLTERGFPTAFPRGTIATPIYTDFAGYQSIPKPASYRTFFVMRDPRDVVVSWYFSAKLSHAAHGDLERIRQELHHLSEADGLIYAIDYLAQFGLFEAQRSWADAPTRDPHVMLMRYEDLIGPGQRDFIASLLSHCDLRVPAKVLAELLDEYRFEKLSGRAPGQEDAQAHYRKGVAGDWRGHFDDRVQRRFREIAGDVLDVWNYAS